MSSFRATWNAHANEYTSVKWHIMVAAGFRQQFEKRTFVYLLMSACAMRQRQETRVSPRTRTRHHVDVQRYTYLRLINVCHQVPVLHGSIHAYLTRHLLLCSSMHATETTPTTILFSFILLATSSNRILPKCSLFVSLASGNSSRKTEKKRWKIKRNIWFSRQFQLHRVSRWKKMETNRKKNKYGNSMKWALSNGNFMNPKNSWRSVFMLISYRHWMKWKKKYPRSAQSFKWKKNLEEIWDGPMSLGPPSI